MVLTLTIINNMDAEINLSDARTVHEDVILDNCDPPYADAVNYMSYQIISFMG